MSALTDKARALRNVIENLSINLTDEEALDSKELCPAWQPNVLYTVGTRVRYNDILYKVLQEHTSQEANYTPDVATSLFARVLIPDSEIIPVWEQPDSTNAYSIGDKVYYPDENGNIYVSTINNNVWSPIDYPAGWSTISE